MTGPLPAVLLAAGGSTRMGRTKQLLPYCGRTLVWHAANELLTAGFRPTIVLTGHDAAAVTAAVSDLPLVVHHHSDWQAGIGSTLRTAIAYIKRFHPAVPAVLFALADQPGVNAAHLQALRDAATDTRIAASGYANSVGVPALFPARFFKDLKEIPDSAGAKAILAAFSNSVHAITLSSSDDIDSPSDYADFLARRPKSDPT